MKSNEMFLSCWKIFFCFDSIVFISTYLSNEEDNEGSVAVRQSAADDADERSTPGESMLVRLMLVIMF